jgi:hypothetical protein
MSRWRRRRLPELVPPVLTLAPRQRQRLQRQSRSGRRTWCRFFGPQLELLWSFTSWAAQSDRYALSGAWRLD